MSQRLSGQREREKNIYVPNLRFRAHYLTRVEAPTTKATARIRTTNKHKANDPNPAHPDAQKHLAFFSYV
ncbi:hypothetical protein DAPPUDRAFT_247189 [Daphnia pulex]|uniref:Uncharacterized protein n=1 Tax=Daphnia pulex TaxID=6669 RepID=E9GRX5_DAPPU|nr:hypothetical protein DAPPUDRAFT_247189 [Daphnia pulex]|eukprot:EFX77606.1 hypothetical protein DAPPUDRAFT_247189 [Daphnia pulex]